MLATNDDRLTMPVTSPTPIVVALAPMLRILVPMSRLPLFADGLALCKLSMPFNEKSLLAVMPPMPLMAKLFTLPLKIDTGSVIAEVLPKDNVAEALLASMLPFVLVGEFPEIVSVFAPRVKVPFVKVRVPPTLTAPPIIIPLVRFIVRLLSETAGKVVLVPLPLIMIFVELPPVNVPDVAAMIPLIVKVFAPIEKVPLASINFFAIVKLPFSVSPRLLLIVSVSTVLLTKTPDGIL